MNTAMEQYEMIIKSAEEISQVILNMEGGKCTLAMFVEVLQELLTEGNVSGGTSVVRKLYEVAEVSLEQIELDEGNTATWIALFFEALNDVLDEEIF